MTARMTRANLLAVVNVGRAHKIDRSNDYEHQDIWLYPNYRAWVDDTGGKPLSSRRFTGLLKDLFENQLRLEGVEHRDDNKGSRFSGLRFRTSARRMRTSRSSSPSIPRQ